MYGVERYKAFQAIVEGTWTPERPSWWRGIETGVFDVEPIAAWVPREAAADVERARAKMIAGKLHPFEGPLYRNNGTLAVPEGKVPSDRELWGMDYLVEGAVDLTLAE